MPVLVLAVIEIFCIWAKSVPEAIWTVQVPVEIPGTVKRQVRHPPAGQYPLVTVRSVHSEVLDRGSLILIMAPVAGVPASGFWAPPEVVPLGADAMGIVV